MILIFLLVSALVLGWKFLTRSDSSQSSVAILASPDPETKPSFAPKDDSPENELLFGGALKKVEDFKAVTQDASYWTVFQGVDAGDAKVYSETTFSPDYKQLIENPRHYRYAGKPIKVTGLLKLWNAKKVEENPFKAEVIYRSYIFDGWNYFVVDTLEKPPVDSDEFGRATVEASGLFYQVFRYETQEPLSNLFLKAAALIKRAQYEYALEDLQSFIEQEPHPGLVAKYVRAVPGELWDAFKSKGPEYVAVAERLNSLAEKGFLDANREDLAAQYFKINAPFLIAKPIRKISQAGASSAFDRFMGSGVGMITALAVVFAAVGIFSLLVIRTQKTNEEKHKKEREDFWREVRRNVKGITPPGSGRMGGDPENPLDPGGPLGSSGEKGG